MHLEREQTNLQTRSFEKQFRLETLSLGSAKIDTVDISPDIPQGNPIGFLLGWGGQIKDCGIFYKGFFDSGKRVFSTQYPTEAPKIKEDGLPHGYSKSGYRNAIEFAEAVVAKGITRLDLVGHSEGAGILLMANQLLTEWGVQVDSLILVNATGFKELKIKEVLHRFQIMDKQEKQRAKANPEFAQENKKLFKQTLKLILRHPINMAREALDASKTDLSALLADALLRGQHIGIIQAGDDPFTQYNEVGSGVAKTQQQARHEQITNLRKMYPNLLTDQNQRNAFDAAVSSLNTKDESLLTVTVPENEGAGHLFNGFYPGTYAPLAADILNYFRTGEIPQIA